MMRMMMMVMTMMRMMMMIVTIRVTIRTRRRGRGRHVQTVLDAGEARRLVGNPPLGGCLVVAVEAIGPAS